MIVNEKISFENPLLSLKIFQNKRIDHNITTWHYHKELEILAVISGQLEVHVEEDVYSLEAGDIILIGSNELHRDRMIHEELKYIVLQFDIEQYFDYSIMPYIKYFAGTNDPLSHLNYIFKNNDQAKKEIFETVSNIYNESKNKETGYEIAVTLFIHKIMLVLLRNDTNKTLNVQHNADFLRLKPVLDYIDSHLTEKISIDTAAKMVNMSYYHFVKFFKNTIQMTFIEYVNYKKIKKAERMLLTKEDSITQIGESINMNNMAHFYKIFKKYNGCSPNEFRKKMLQWKSK
ncbi:AraC family transcriptional regulator [Chengkuizengella axinellae]|uniref:AraC family transcriptional regulator n=1 Tax=Chengkuizengella axinellae TaxID=3064388 RepID=A0ABT9IYK1_9BACL|nr:AraC family transcriptional regulator [Chengkuizengella sp. 2205SS18-9]MDP5274432.1 AraC family transcriptional regulator [Chengkuizengella sp. 2205SS18-9]